MIRIRKSCYEPIFNQEAFLALVSLLLLLPIPVPAADSGIAGQVNDPQGKAVPGAQMHLVRRDGARQESKTDEQGRFRFEGLAPAITASLPARWAFARLPPR